MLIVYAFNSYTRSTLLRRDNQNLWTRNDQGSYLP